MTTMSKTSLILFWSLWLLDVLIALFAYREFMGQFFGRYSGGQPMKFILLWVLILAAIVLVIAGSLYFKNHDRSSAAITVAIIPLILALPYALFLGVLMLSGGNRWN